MLNVIYSNRTEILLDALLEILAQPLSSPLVPEYVVVPGAAVGRWLTLRIAERFGICTNIRFLFPAQFIWQALRALAPQPGSDSSGFVPEINAWRLFRLLPPLASAPGFEPVAHYLADADECQRYELAAQIGGCFDRYLVFRPDWVREWESGGSGHWQARLWRELVGEGGVQHWVHGYDAFLSALKQISAEAASLPARVAVFGVHALSPSYLQVLNALSSRLIVHLLQLDPCREYWGDIIAPRTQAKLMEEGSAVADYAETGNALLASMGRHGRDFIDAINDITDQAEDRYGAPAEDTLLARVQRDILELRDADSAEIQGDSGREETAPGETGDGSIAVHSCHSPLREVQVLHDQLLAMFERWPDLTPGDIVVMTPDVERHAPAVSAVFGTAPDGCHIPYTLSDIHAVSGDRISAVFLDLLSLGDDRFDVQRVLAPLDLPAVRRRFELSEEECERFRDWVRESGIRWGADASMRGALGLPASGEHTWQYGFDRLLLGHALPRVDALFGELLPCDGAEGTRARSLGKLLGYYDALLAVRTETQATRSAEKWAALLRRWIATLLLAEDDEEEDAIDGLLEAITLLDEEIALAGVTEPLSAAVIRMRLEQLLGADRAGIAAVRGAVAFCNLSALPAIPSPVICLLGMDGDRFPRNPPRPDFDLMAAGWRRGDRSRRDEDRYLFLLALLSARRCLYLSYVGQDLHDNSSIPPSVLVDELLDYIDRYPRNADDDPRRDTLVVKHPLQPFSARYFDGLDARLFSYRQGNCIAPVGGAGTRRPPFIPEPLPPADEQWTQLSVDELLDFYRHPVRFLLQRRLRIDLSVHAQELECSEPFELPPREAVRMREEWMARVQRGVSVQEAQALMRAGGLLPHGPVGDLILGEEAAAAEALRVRALTFGEFSATTSAHVDIALGRFSLSGRLTDTTPDGLVKVIAGKLFESLRLDLWLRHLILHCVASRAPPRRSLCVAAEEAFSFRQVSEPGQLLGQLLEDYWCGLHRPLRFFPRSAYVYQDAVHRGQDSEVAFRKAQKCWRGNDHAAGEGEDPYYRALFSESEPLDEEFAALAQRIYGPLLAHMEEL